jgi:hypothetical protein
MSYFLYKKYLFTFTFWTPFSSCRRKGFQNFHFQRGKKAWTFYSTFDFSTARVRKVGGVVLKGAGDCTSCCQSGGSGYGRERGVKPGRPDEFLKKNRP